MGTKLRAKIPVYWIIARIEILGKDQSFTVLIIIYDRQKQNTTLFTIFLTFSIDTHYQAIENEMNFLAN
jgi:hypothetical protein